MIAQSKKQAQPRLIFSSLVLLMNFILSGCSPVDGAYEDTGSDTLTPTPTVTPTPTDIPTPSASHTAYVVLKEAVVVNGTTKLTWQMFYILPTLIEIYRNNDDDWTGAVRIGSMRGGNEFIDNNVMPGLTYYYWVKVTNADSIARVSNVESATITSNAETPTPISAPQPNPSASSCDTSELLAFPCAEGYGKHASGGRGGKVCEVTNLNSTGSGSFKDCASKSGTTVVFRVSGTIEGGASVADNVTIAGQTAPGDGIQLRGALDIGSSNIIVRYLRVRLKGGGDAIAGGHGDKNIMLDHLSASWSTDEIFSTYFNKNFTIQWSMITEANSGDHKFGGIWGNDNSTYHHNLFAHNSDRTPRIASGSGFNDVRNNVIYNWSNLATYGCEVHQVGDASRVGCSTNVVGNYYKAGPATPDENKTRIIIPASRTGNNDYGDFYVADNYLFGHPDVTADNWLGVIPHYRGKIERDVDAVAGLKLDLPSTFMPINQQTAEAAYQSVLEHAGCSKPNRDSHDARIVEEVRTGTATHGNGHVSSPTELPVLKSTTPPVDSDHDGMPDDWERANGLDPNNVEDRNQTWGPGYTMLEKYLNSLDSFHDSSSNNDNSTGNTPPVAKIGAITQKMPGQTVMLDGSSSSDQGGGTLSYLWTQIQGDTISLAENSNSTLSFVAPEVTQPTQYTFQLTVNDGELSNVASVTVRVSPVGSVGLCDTATEGNSLTLSCPSGQLITGVNFASYGTPNGSCGSFSTGSCNANSSESVVSTACKGKNNCTVYAGNDKFGDPCEGTVKKLAAEVVCGMAID